MKYLTLLSTLLLVGCGRHTPTSPIGPTLSTSPFSIDCSLVGSLPCQKPPVAAQPAPVEPIVPIAGPSYPPGYPLPPEPPSVPPAATSCGVPYAFDPDLPLVKEFIWLATHRGLTGAYGAWIEERCRNPVEAAVEDRIYNQYRLPGE